MGPALQSTAGMLTGRRLLQREAVTEGETAHIPRRDTHGSRPTEHGGYADGTPSSTK